MALEGLKHADNRLEAALNYRRSELEDEPFRDGNWATCPRCGKEFWLIAEMAPRYSAYRTPSDGPISY